MTLQAYVGGDDLAYTIRIGAVGLTSRYDGSIGTGGIEFDDPDKSLTIRGWQYVKVVETACVAAPILYAGFIADRRYTRVGQQATYKSGVSRFIDSNVNDLNILLNIRRITNPDGKRDAESHNERIDFFLGSAYNAGPVIDDGQIDRSHPRPMEEADYRTELFADVLSDVAGPINKMFFVYPTQPDADPALYFANPDTVYGVSPLRISNDPDDADDSTFYPLIDAELGRDPSELNSLLMYKFRNGQVLEGNTTTYNAFFSAAATGGPELGNRGQFVDNERVGLESSARIMAQSILTKDSEERDTITVAFIVPDEQVGFVGAPYGSIYVKFMHIDDYEDFALVRVAARTIFQSGQVDGQGRALYVVSLELSNHGLSGNGGGGSGGTGGFPQPQAQSVSIIQKSVGLSSRTLPAPSTTADPLVVLGSLRAGAVTMTGYTDSGAGNVSQGAADYVNAGYKASIGEQTFVFANLNAAIGFYELSAGATPGTPVSAHGTSLTAATAAVSVPAGGLLFVVAGLGAGGGFDHGGYNDPFAWQVPPGWTVDLNQMVFDGHPSSLIGYYQNTGTAAISVTPSFPFFDNGEGAQPWQIIAWPWGPPSGSIPPDPAQDVPWEIVTMSTVNGVSVGTTANPYADRSLQVKVDGVLISPASFTETDGSCGDFALSWKIDADEVVTVKYVGR